VANNPNEWVTVSTHPNAAMAQLDATMLREHGISALLPNVETSSALPHLSNALGGVQVQVPASDVHRARLLLGLDADGRVGTGDDDYDDIVGDDWRRGSTLHEVDARWASEAAGPHAASKPLTPGSHTRPAGERAWRTAIIGCMFPPLHFYAVVLAVKPDDLPEGAPHWHRVAALAISVPSVLAQLWILAMLMR
jgi:hypothetical protein